jgi:hypothetical protein
MVSPECLKEVDHAAASHKRLIPVVCREVDPKAVPDALSKLNWIFLREQDDFERGVDTLLTAVDTDLEWVDAHTRLLGKTVDWERQGQDRSLLLRGSDLRGAESWLSQSGTKEPKPTDLQGRFILTSRQAETKRQRQVRRAVTVGLLVAAVLAGLFWYQRGVARQRGQIALGRQLAAQADKLSDSRLNLALLLGVAAMQVHPTLEAQGSLLTILQKHPKISSFLTGHKKTSEVWPSARTVKSWPRGAGIGPSSSGT